MVRLVVVSLLALVTAVTACGGSGNDQADVRQVVRDFVTATNKRDGVKLCGKLLTREYMEKATGASGSGAEKACKQQLGLLTGLRLKLASVGRAAVKGDTATVRAVIVAAGQRASRVFTLAKQDGNWKLSSGEAAK